MSELPKPGETWYSRDGRVAVVSAYDHPRLTLQAEYSDGHVTELLSDGMWVNGCSGSRHDLVRRSPWDAVREAILSGKRQDMTGDMWGFCMPLVVDAERSCGGDVAHGPWLPAEDIQSAALEFVAWAELRGLTPENLGDLSVEAAA